MRSLGQAIHHSVFRAPVQREGAQGGHELDSLSRKANRLLLGTRELFKDRMFSSSESSDTSEQQETTLTTAQPSDHRSKRSISESSSDHPATDVISKTDENAESTTKTGELCTRNETVSEDPPANVSEEKVDKNIDQDATM